MKVPALRPQHWLETLDKAGARARLAGGVVAEGRLTRIVGLTLEAVGLQVPLGGRCEIVSDRGARIEAEVVGFSGGNTFLMPVDHVHGLTPDARVVPLGTDHSVAVGHEMLGRVVDGVGRPLDGKGPLHCTSAVSLTGTPINPLEREPVSEPLDVGVRAINGLLSVGRGQRMGLFAGSGVGKSVLLGMMTRYTSADITVVGLIGERGREVNEFVRNSLGSEGLQRSVVVASPADDPPLARLHGAWYATAIAEYFRDRGLKVLLLIDSLTRFAQAQREIALAIGEPPVTKGYTPSVFAKLPQLVERAGNGSRADGGSITAFYTVLTEGDDHNDPIADSARAILDGHVVLSRQIADGGRYPAIDIESSVSRIMHDVVDREHLLLARRFKQVYSTYARHRDLISVGAYQRGNDPQVDEAMDIYPRLEDFLRQDMHEAVDYANSVQQVCELFAPAKADESGLQAGDVPSADAPQRPLADYTTTQTLA
jgi:flagellum-specific ATP synthase